MMKAKELWNKLFAKNVAPAAPVEQEEVRQVMPTPYDYGLGILEFALSSEDYGWEINPFKKVTLTNVRDCENKISLMSMVAAWKGTGHSEWEFVLAGWFVMQVKEALEQGLDEADITMLFDRDLLARDNRRFSQKQIYEHLIPWFEVVEDSEDELKLAIRIG